MAINRPTRYSSDPWRVRIPADVRARPGKRHARSAHGRAEEEIYNLSSPFVDAYPSITFNNDDLRDLHLPHDDALVVSIVIAKLQYYYDCHVMIGTELTDKLRSALMYFLKRNFDVFAWSQGDILGINPHVATHTSYSPTPEHPIVCQKRRKFAPECLKVIEEEVSNLIKANVVREVYYQDWLANDVVTLKKGENGETPKSKAQTRISPDGCYFVDRSSNQYGCGAELVFQAPSGEQMEYAIRIGFKATNNEAGYEALLAGLRVAAELRVDSLDVFSESKLVVNQVQGDYLAKDMRMVAYLDETLSILPRPRARRKQYPGSWRADEHSGGGSGELSGDDLAKFHELVLPRSRGFGDKHRLGRSRATSSEMARSGDLDSLPSWISDHLGQGFPYMTNEVNQSPSSPMEGSHEESSLVAIHPSVEEKTNIMTLEELNALRDTYSFPSGVQIKLPDEGETITSTRPGEVAFYEAAFPAGLRFPVHNTIRLILQFYNICPAQLVPNAWRSIACSMALWRVYRYSISLSEFRNLFSLNSNPKPDQGWLYFKARNKKVLLLGGYPSNVKGWKSKFFFVSGDEWEIPEEKSRKGAARVPRTWGIPNKHCNNPPRLFDDKMKVFEEIFRSIEESGRFSVPVLLDWTPNHFAKSLPLPVLGRRGRRAIIRRAEKQTELRKLLPHIPDLTLLRWTGGKVLDPILGNYLNVPSTNPSSESCSDSSQPVELESDAMSKRVSFKNIGEKLRKAAGASSGTPAPANGVVIGEKRARESITSSPSKKAKADDGSKGKGVDIGPEGKKKASSSSKTSAAPTVVPSHPKEGTSAYLGAILGSAPSILGSPSVSERLLRGVIPPADKEKVDKLTLDQTATKLFHVISQALVLGSSLAVRSREAGEQASLQEGRVASMETEVARLQKLATDFEQQLAKSRAREQQSLDELAKAKGDRDSLADHLGKSGALVNELREALNKAKESAVEEFKSSSEFMVAVEDAASKYFGEGFNFCKVQLCRHHPDLAVDLEGTVVDQDLLAELDEAEEENDKGKTGEHDGGKK
ncbi:hypothetical protein Acr_07g0012260 [Actinidia rufa]|uniref:RNase H type-1 domain-containing protein n=1 Tax=Actinidia rufa TaxID=165716 RepID=A0A7J0EXA5_9ERIC|nr:hypothetical protein Acr_07g0012260 [Actinidia rufa]